MDAWVRFLVARSFVLSQLPRKRPLLQRGEQGVQLGQGRAVGGFEGFDGLDAGGEG
ncbi:MAG: hypothetical protein KGN32_07290 [Burkholderiales bacterium]|nr:hypothetical protein [Burkholderiales bacterium]